MRKIHKISGLSVGILLLILAFTGFFLNHENWNFLNTITFKNVPKNAIDLQKKSWQAYLINNQHILAGGKRGLYESYDGGKTFKKTLDKSIFIFRTYNNYIYAATNDGIYIQTQKSAIWTLFDFENEYINSMNIYKDNMVIAIDKRKVVLINLKNNHKIFFNTINIEEKNLQHDITLSRFVRDLHYGRGLFDGDISLFINDYGSIVLVILFLTGFLIWYYVSNIKKNNTYKNKIKFLVKIHSNILVVVAIIPLFILSITGIFLDHSSDLRKFMKTTILPNTILPPVYNTLQADIWGVDYDGSNYYIGNRYGVYKSKDLKKFDLVSKGFAYKLIRQNDNLYISGMGSKNRILKDNKFINLNKTPHMFKDVIINNNNYKYFSTSTKNIKKYKLPYFANATLYDILLSLHDGSFFSSWWIWINDIAAVLFVILAFSGFVRWRKRIKNKKIGSINA